jgi:hypothetical protein
MIGPAGQPDAQSEIELPPGTEIQIRYGENLPLLLIQGSNPVMDPTLPQYSKPALTTLVIS